MVKLSSKFQVVIPERVREALGLRPGAMIDVIAKGHVAYLVPVPTMQKVRSLTGKKASKRGLRDKKDRI